MMKKLIVLFMSFYMSIGMYAHSEEHDYTDLMRATINKMDSLKSVGELQICKNSFERIAKVYDEEWLPAYYIAFCNIELVYSDRQSEKNQLRLEEAKKHLKSLQKKKDADMSEVENLWGYYYMCLISRDPDKMGQELFQTTITKFESAMEFNPENPRPIVLLAFFEQRLPPFLKSKRVETEEVKKAEGLFAQENISWEKPHWGRNFIEIVKSNSKLNK